MRSLPRSVLILAMCASARAAAAPAAAPLALPFLDNDYAGAIAQARAKGVPVFVEVWAPW